MLVSRRLLRRRSSRLAAIALVVLLVCFVLLPPDSSIKLALYFNLSRLPEASTAGRDAWLSQAAKHDVQLDHDVGYLIKTGYGTRRRLKEQLQVMKGILGTEGSEFLVVGDWTPKDTDDGAQDLGATIHDAIKPVMDGRIGARHKDHPRFAKYKSIQAAVDKGDYQDAKGLGQQFGWELDALKFITGMELLYDKLPPKKWYIVLDDDTYLVKESLEALLSRLDPYKPQYLGNAVGDFKARFAHGGSGVIVSRGAMDRLFRSERRDVIAGAYAASLDETWGDRLVATTLLKVGVYLDEKRSHHFNGERPRETRIRADRTCSPVVSFHGLRTKGDMTRAAEVLASRKPAASPLLWSQLWSLLAQHPMQAYGREKAAAGLPGDHVGRPDESTVVWVDIKDAAECRARCEGGKATRWCVAWTYDPAKSQCRASPWAVVGSEDAGGKVSGLNWDRLAPVMANCRPSDEVDG